MLIWQIFNPLWCVVVQRTEQIKSQWLCRVGVQRVKFGQKWNSLTRFAKESCVPAWTRAVQLIHRKGLCCLPLLLLRSSCIQPSKAERNSYSYYHGSLSKDAREKAVHRPPIIAIRNSVGLQWVMQPAISLFNNSQVFYEGDLTHSNDVISLLISPSAEKTRVAVGKMFILRLCLSREVRIERIFSACINIINQKALVTNWWIVFTVRGREGKNFSKNPQPQGFIPDLSSNYVESTPTIKRIPAKCWRMIPGPTVV